MIAKKNTKIDQALRSAARLESEDGKLKHPREPWRFDLSGLNRGLATVVGDDGQTVATFKTFGAAQRAIVAVNMLQNITEKDVNALTVRNSPVWDAISIALRALEINVSQASYKSTRDTQAIGVLKALLRPDLEDTRVMLEAAERMIESAEKPRPIDPQQLEAEKIRRLIADPSNRHFEVAYHTYEHYISDITLRGTLKREIDKALKDWKEKTGEELVGALLDADGPVAIVQAKTPGTVNGLPYDGKPEGWYAQDSGTIEHLYKPAPIKGSPKRMVALCGVIYGGRNANQLTPERKAGKHCKSCTILASQDEPEDRQAEKPKTRSKARKAELPKDEPPKHDIEPTIIGWCKAHQLTQHYYMYDEENANMARALCGAKNTIVSLQPVESDAWRCEVCAKKLLNPVGVAVPSSKDDDSVLSTEDDAPDNG